MAETEIFSIKHWLFSDQFLQICYSPLFGNCTIQIPSEYINLNVMVKFHIKHFIKELKYNHLIATKSR